MGKQIMLYNPKYPKLRDHSNRVTFPQFLTAMFILFAFVMIAFWAYGNGPEAISATPANPTAPADYISPTDSSEQFSWIVEKVEACRECVWEADGHIMLRQCEACADILDYVEAP